MRTRWGIDEFLDLLGLVGDLCIALAAMDDLYPKPMGKVIERLVLDVLGNLLCLCACEFLVGQGLPGNVQ